MDRRSFLRGLGIVAATPLVLNQIGLAPFDPGLEKELDSFDDDINSLLGGFSDNNSNRGIFEFSVKQGNEVLFNESVRLDRMGDFKNLQFIDYKKHEGKFYVPKNADRLVLFKDMKNLHTEVNLMGKAWGVTIVSGKDTYSLDGHGRFNLINGYTEVAGPMSVKQG